MKNKTSDPILGPKGMFSWLLCFVVCAGWGEGRRPWPRCAAASRTSGRGGKGGGEGPGRAEAIFDPKEGGGGGVLVVPRHVGSGWGPCRGGSALQYHASDVILGAEEEWGKGGGGRGPDGGEAISTPRGGGGVLVLPRHGGSGWGPCRGGSVLQ